MEIIEYLNQQITNLSNLTLDKANFKKSLLNSLKKIQTENNNEIDFPTLDDDKIFSTSNEIVRGGIENQQKPIIDAIKQYINFDELTNDETSFLYKNLSQSYWNDSMRQTINKLNNIQNSLQNEKDKIDDTNVTIADLKKANAGYIFFESLFSSDPIRETDWVRPNRDMYNYTYGAVRNEAQVTGDAVLSVLRHIIGLQFTHTQDQVFDWSDINKWIRLLMPKNSRRVEIEDLNRNFWVIAQVIAAISGFLFDDDDSLDNLLKMILDEAFQLWDNILWLWIIMLMSIAQDNLVHVELVPYYDGNLNSLRSYERHFDNFYLNSQQKTLENIENKYPNRNLAILLLRRKENYMYNYYKGEEYPYLCLKGKDWDNWVLCELQARVVKDDDSKIIQQTKVRAPIDFSIDDFFGTNLNSKIGQIRFNSKLNDFAYPSYCAADDEKRWFSVIRTIPKVRVTYNEGEFNVESVGFTFYDVASQGQLLKDTDNNDSTETKFNDYFYKLSFSENKVIKEDTENATILLIGEEGKLPNLASYNNSIDYFAATGHSYYLGELVSQHNKFAPFGEWYHLYPLLESDSINGVYEDSISPIIDYHQVNFNFNDIKLVDVHLANTKAREKMWDFKVLSDINNENSEIINDTDNLDNRELYSIANYYSATKYKEENNPLSLCMYSRAYQTNKAQNVNIDYDKYIGRYQKSHQGDAAEISNGYFKTYPLRETPITGNQLMFISTNAARLGSCVQIGNYNDPLFKNIGTVENPQYTCNIGNLRNPANLYIEKYNGVPISRFLFPQRVEYFSESGTSGQKLDDWIVRFTALNVSIVKESQIEGIKNDYTHLIKEYKDGEYAVLTSKILIYCVPAKNNVAMRCWLIQNNYDVELSNDEIPSINSISTYTIYGGNSKNSLNELRELTFDINNSFNKTIYDFQEKRDFNCGDLINKFENTDNVAPVELKFFE